MQPRPQRRGRVPHIVEFRIVYFGIQLQFIFDVRHATHFCQNVMAFCQDNIPGQVSNLPGGFDLNHSFIIFNTVLLGYNAKCVWVRSREKICMSTMESRPDKVINLEVLTTVK
ncbi:MAG: hypothetical protein EZS28_027983 [Streblomastix strix]|uniref:Uncharacterized protein n=1 Tax=Streblomastix strix TaxID=222440 RepID=A0A5J4V336_9EUKA|nr:MAG: hypothetical protein EZS28_027983 [Streblomastix strix]